MIGISRLWPVAAVKQWAAGFLLLVVSLWVHGAGGELPVMPRLGSGELDRVKMVEVLERWQYGHAPDVPSFEVENLVVKEVRVEGVAGMARLVTAELVFGPRRELRMQVGCWLPGGDAAEVPVVLGIEPVWWPDPFLRRGVVKRLLSRGYGFAGFDHNALASYEDPKLRAAQQAYPDYDWGVVAVAAWGCRVTLSWVQDLKGVRPDRIAVWGHSRRGKSALLAGALDERFAAVAPHMSGMAGSALYRVRGKGAQELEQLLERYWLGPRAFSFIDREKEMPFDQHWLLSMVAPRACYVHVGREDYWGNPEGERAAYEAGREVYRGMGVISRLVLGEVDAGHVDPNGPEGGASWEGLLDFLEGPGGGALSGKREAGSAERQAVRAEG
ncbi:MAG: hypothetical protein RI897_2984 [Verrucomicrobiota bacterium]